MGVAARWQRPAIVEGPSLPFPPKTHYQAYLSIDGVGLGMTKAQVDAAAARWGPVRPTPGITTGAHYDAGRVYLIVGSVLLSTESRQGHGPMFEWFRADRARLGELEFRLGPINSVWMGNPQQPALLYRVLDTIVRWNRTDHTFTLVDARYFDWPNRLRVPQRIDKLPVPDE